MKRVNVSAPFAMLRRALSVPIWADVGLRLGVAFGLIFVVIIVHWLGRDGIRDSFDGDVSFIDVVYFTMISITTTGFGDITPVSDNARLIEAVIVTPIRLMVIYLFVGTAYNFLIKRTWEKWRMARIQARLSGHIIILGFGVSGAQAVTELIDRGADPHQIVVLDKSPGRLAIAERMGCNVIEGDATRDETLVTLRIAEAQAILVSAGRDDTTILIVLTANHLAPNVPISAVIRTDDNELLARQAGADNVINPVRFTGLLLAGSAQGAHIAEYLSDLASVSGRVQLVERPAAKEEFGKPLDQLASGGRGLRIYRDGRPFGFWEKEAQHIQSGDTIVEIIPTTPKDAAT